MHASPKTVKIAQLQVSQLDELAEEIVQFELEFEVSCRKNELKLEEECRKGKLKLEEERLKNELKQIKNAKYCVN